jgi:hypothetical protein
MPLYLSRFSYTPQTWATPIGNPEDRRKAAIGAGGALDSLETTVLMTVDETMDALRVAQQIQYKPPGT